MQQKKKIAPEQEPEELYAVHPRRVRFHALLGKTYFRQHYIYEAKWQHRAVGQQFKFMAEVLSRRQVMCRIENRRKRNVLADRHKELRNETNGFNNMLHMALVGQNELELRSLLLKHHVLLRLYQHLPIDAVVEKINQRTFSMRKERDLLKRESVELQSELEAKMIRITHLKTRIDFQENFMLDDEKACHELQAKIANSNTRLKGFTYINEAYKEMEEVLQHEIRFHDPIADALEKDLKDQENFIEHVHIIGPPAFTRYKELRVEFKAQEELERTTAQNWAKLGIVFGPRRWTSFGRQRIIMKKKDVDEEDELKDDPRKTKGYARESPSMLVLKKRMTKLEDVIKRFKVRTRCTRSKQIYPHIKAQFENNVILAERSKIIFLTEDAMKEKRRRAELLRDDLVYNLNEETLKRQYCIKSLEEELKQAEEEEQKMLRKIKANSKLLVELRHCMWNIHEVLRHVDRVPTKPRLQYPTFELKLPLLRFDMLEMKSVPPSMLEEDIIKLAELAKRKLKKLLGGVKKEPTQQELDEYYDFYHKKFIESLRVEVSEEEEPKQIVEEEESEFKLNVKERVPTRKIIKQRSAKLIEEFVKKENE